MADGGFPNKNRASNAYDAYGDAMRPYVARVLEDAHGPDWIRLRLLSDDLRENNRRRYDEIRQALQAKKPLEEIVDRADIPNLVNGDRENFPDLNRDEIRNLFTIRGLRNAIVHSGRGDCTIEEANAIIGLCVLTLERCGLFDAAENVRGLSLETATGAAEVSEAELRQQRERREWDKARLGGKSPGELTPWEQQRLAEIEWEEEWERRESERREIAQFGEDTDGLRFWFNADEARHDRHPSEYVVLLQQEQERRERERTEITAFGEDIDGLRRWFDADGARRDRHSSEHAALLQQERRAQREREREQRERERREQERRKKQRRENELQERERSEIAAFGDDLDGLRHWFDTYKIRPKRHPSQYAALLQQEEEQHGRERVEIAAFGEDIDGLRRWFDADGARRDRHSSEHAALLQQERRAQREREREQRERERREQERRKKQRRENELQERERSEIAAFGDDLDGLRHWFDTYKIRPKRHPSQYAALLQQEEERREQELQNRERRERREQETREAAKRERERAEITAFGDDIDGLRRWFHKDNVRRRRHPSEYAALHQRERRERRGQETQEAAKRKRERERAEIAALGNDLNGLRSWFNADTGRQQRHSDEYATLEQSERSLFSRIFRRR